MTALILGVLSVAFVWVLFQKPGPAALHLDAMPPLLPSPVIQKYNAPEELFVHKIVSEPKGATVFLDGVRKGFTPLEILLPMSQANHPFRLRFELEGFQTLEFETLLGPHLADVEKHMRPLPPGRRGQNPAPVPPTPIEDIPSMDLGDGS
jgi:hypothetical protein